MDADRKHVLLALAAVGAAAAVGLAGTRERIAGPRGPSKANVAARVVSEPPPGATVVAPSDAALGRIPGARTVIRRAVRNDATDDWEHLTTEGEGAWNAVDVLHRDLPYFEADESDAEDGVYVACEGSIVVLDAIGWASPDVAR